MRFQLLVFLSVLALTNCDKEDNVPSHTVYGDPMEPIVFNLQIIDPLIQSKNPTLRGNQSGNVRLAQDRFVVYEPASDFTFDQLEVVVDRTVVASIAFISREINPDCSPFIRSYSFTIKASENINQTIFFEFCDVSAANSTGISDTNLSGITGFQLSNIGGVIYFTFSPEASFRGSAEFFYEVGSFRPGNSSSFYEADLLLSATAKIEVVD